MDIACKENWDDDDDDYDSDYDDDFEEIEEEDTAIDWFEDNIPANYREFADTSVQSGPSSGAKKTNEPNRQTKAKSASKKSKKVRKDGDKEVKPRRGNHKVEMRSVFISNDIKNKIMTTLRDLNGQNFNLTLDVTQSKRKLDNRYWVDQGQLIVRNYYNFGKKKNPNEPEVNSILLETLESYGFFTKHCHEALVHTKNLYLDSVKFLLNAYFGVQFGNEGSEAAMKNASELDEELATLKSIYENMVEERDAHNHWVFHLHLPHLAEWYFQKAFNEGMPANRHRGRKKPLCRNFSNRGTCRFGANCRFLHESPEETKRSSACEEERRKKSAFDLEIRFTDDCVYPNGVPVILFSALHKDFSNHVALRVTKLLLKEASVCAAQGDPYCFNLTSLLTSDRVVEWLKNEAESAIRIDSNRALLTTETDVCEEEEEEEIPSSSSASSKPKYQPLESRPPVNNRDDDIIENMKRKYHSRDYQSMLRSRQSLPAWDAVDDILDLLKDNQVIVVVGETGCGKSTQIPQFLLDQWLYPAAGVKSWKSPFDHVDIICTQPRRISAIGVATRVAQERLERVGEVVGYQISLESSMSSLTKLLFCTTGILLKKLVGDPLLETVTHIIVDEVHERSEESDFLLLILKELLVKRKDVRVILMSATLNAGLFSAYFNGAPLVEIPGKMYPVTELYLEDILERCDFVVDEYSKNSRKMTKTMTRLLDDVECDLALADSLNKDTMSKKSTPDECLSAKQLFYRYRDYSPRTRKSILMMDQERVDPELIVAVLSWIVDGRHEYPRQGSILVFLPGMADITAVHDELKGHRSFNQRNSAFMIIPLHSSISNEEQSLVFKKAPRGVRKIVLSTNIAETSITIDDCVFVIDCGKMKENRFDTNKNMSSLDTVWISRANAHQRRGRAGRVMPGLCIRLYTHHRFENVLNAQPIPEIRRVPLDQIILFTRSLINFKMLSIEQVLEKLIEPPYSNDILTAVKRLQDIGALDEQKELTALGRHLSVLPVDVKIGKLILFGAVFCCLDSVLTIAASLSNKSPFVSPFSKRDVAEAKKKEFALCNSDHLTVLNAYKKWREQSSSKWVAGKRFAEENFLSWRTLETMADLKHQYLQLLQSIGFVSINSAIRRRQHEDRVLQMTPVEFNKNGNNNRLLSSIICAALYPNLVEVLTPDKVYKPGVSGSIPSEHSADDLKFKTKSDGYVHLHPSSVNHGVSKYISPYLVYQEKMKTSKVFIHDSTMVQVISLILFAGAELKIELNSGLYIASLEDGWLSFSFRSLEDAKMLQHMRLELNKLLEKKIENPHLNLTDKYGNQIISTITDIITQSTT